MHKQYRRIILIVAGFLFAGGLSPVTAQEVTLRSADGSVELSGELLEFDGEFYRIKSRFGEMTLNALGITCTGLNCPDPGQYASDITISGARTTIGTLLPGLIEEFGFSSGLTTLRNDHDYLGWTYFVADPACVPVARIQATPNGSVMGFADLTAGLTDLAVSVRLPSEGELKAARAAKIGNLKDPYRQTILAIDAMVFVVSKENPVSSLTLDEIAKLFSGEIINWKELGGYDAPVTLFRPTDAGDLGRDFLATVFPKDGKPQAALGREITSVSEL